MGLLINGLVKVPMQFAILLIGVLVFTFYQFNKAPIFFNEKELTKLEKSEYKDSLSMLKVRMTHLQDEKTALLQEYAKVKDLNQLGSLKSLDWFRQRSQGS